MLSRGRRCRSGDGRRRCCVGGEGVGVEMVGEDVEREGEGTTITIIGIGIRLLDSSYKLFAV